VGTLGFRDPLVGTSGRRHILLGAGRGMGRWMQEDPGGH